MQNPDERIKFASQQAVEYERKYHGCAQCVLAAIQDAMELPGLDVFKAATGLCGGVGCLGETCGALTGAVLGIGLMVGRERSDWADEEKVHWQNYEMVREIHGRFVKEYGGVSCRNIQKKIFGRSFDMWNPSERKEFGKLGAHSSHCSSCSHVVGNAAAWAVQVMLEHK